MVARRPTSQRGQTLPLLAIFLVVLCGAAALTIDVGRAWYAKRQLQASVDAAALAAAGDLPSGGGSFAAIATDYLRKNPIQGTTSVAGSVRTRCLANAAICDNVVDIDETVTTPSIFGKVLGIGSYTISAHSSACNPCGEKPLDIVVVLDRTGSMGQGGNPNKITNAKNGILGLLNFMDPNVVSIGLAVLPPVDSGATVCQAGTRNSYNSASSKYLVVPLSNDYKSSGALNAASPLVSAVNCVQPGGSTGYAVAISAAESELAANGRPDADHVIIFLTDGAANIGPAYLAPTDPLLTQPCHSGVNRAAAAKAAGTIVYTIGYALSTGGGCSASAGGAETPAITPTQALSAMASDPTKFFNQPTTGQLDTIFQTIAAQISAQASLIR